MGGTSCRPWGNRSKTVKLCFGAPGWIRTSEGISRQIYSLLWLTTPPPTHGHYIVKEGLFKFSTFCWTSCSQFHCPPLACSLLLTSANLLAIARRPDRKWINFTFYPLHHRRIYVIVYAFLCLCILSDWKSDRLLWLIIVNQHGNHHRITSCPWWKGCV